MANILAFARRFLGHTGGATAIEYGLIAALISIGIIGASRTIGTSVRDSLNSVASNMSR